mgnify:CR=1 FL=1
MKKRIMIIFVVCALVSALAYSRQIAWKPREKPPVSLRLALTLAEEELQKEDVEYFCIGAGLAKTFSDGDWAFHFSSEKGEEIWVNIGSDQKIKKSKTGFEYW